MTPSISWIEADGLAATLARMGVRAARTRRLRPISASASASERAWKTAELVAADGKPDAIDSEDAPAIPEPVVAAPRAAKLEEVAAAVVPEYIPTAGPLRDRLEGFVAWLSATTGARSSFVVDTDGIPLVDRSADPNLLAVASSVLQLIEMVNGKQLIPLGHLVDLELERGLLSLVTVETPIGNYIVGQVVDRSLPPETREAVDVSLRRVFRADTA